MDIVKIVGFAICACSMGLILKQAKAEYMILIGLVASLFICGYMVTALTDVVEKIRGVWTSLVLDDTFINLLLEIIGITYLCEFVSSICKEVGYTTLATQIVIAGKVGILLVGFPIIWDLLDFIVSM